jgi:hypothetical protein
MKKAVGLWIDHRKAVIVAVTDEGEEGARRYRGLKDGSVAPVMHLFRVAVNPG